MSSKSQQSAELAAVAVWLAFHGHGAGWIRQVSCFVHLDKDVSAVHFFKLPSSHLLSQEGLTH